ncbi:MAG: signal recognition particle subunit SRP19/SEC65 family protein [Methanomassiliicoccaceae archaeon]|jgi:signal recognition particle subunit SRP19|nr:signal recognition particle subunit SRP19/SEC65 family protein [Methanomassiliicoccaceae archaeon]
MTYDKDNAIVLWPEYFEVGRKRSQGRRVPKELCVKEPSLDIIAKAAAILDLEYEIFDNAAYPANWSAKRGCVRVEKGKMKKSKLLLKVGQCLVDNQ